MILSAFKGRFHHVTGLKDFKSLTSTECDGKDHSQSYSIKNKFCWGWN